MSKSQAMSAIVRLWMEQPESDRTHKSFNDFYDHLETNHPDLLKWPLEGGMRDKEVRGYLAHINLIK